MAGKWVKRKIGSLGRVVTGKTPPTADSSNFNGPYPFITIPDLDGRVLIDTTERTVSEKGAKILRSCLLPPGSVMMSCIATVGKCGITTRPSFTNQQINSVIPNDEVDSRFLYYGFAQLGYELESAGGGGSVYTNVSKSRFSDIEVVVPIDKDEQRAIAHILGTLDDKIELNRQMNQTLEDMARALFKSWFVEFDPVRAKVEGRETGLPKPIAALFPGSFENSKLDKIPTGWKDGRFGDVVAQIHDQENPLAAPNAEFSHYSIPAFDEGQWPKTELGKNIKSLKSCVPTDVILFSKLNPEIERVWLVDVRSGDRAVCSTEFLVLRARSPFTRSYAYCLARSPKFRQQVESLVTGTSKSHQRARVNTVLNLNVYLPPPPTVATFDRFASSLLAQTLSRRRESQNLAALRDILLPKLISGKLRVRDAERFNKERGL